MSCIGSQIKTKKLKLLWSYLALYVTRRCWEGWETTGKYSLLPPMLHPSDTTADVCQNNPYNRACCRWPSGLLLQAMEYFWTQGCVRLSEHLSGCLQCLLQVGPVWHCAQMLMDSRTGSARIDWFPLQKTSMKRKSPTGHSDLWACAWQEQQVLTWNVRALSPEHSGEVAALVSQLRLKSAWKPRGQLTQGNEPDTVTFPSRGWP